MKKQGFTLVEMLAVLVVIVLLATLLIPTMINLITKNKNKLSEKTESIIFAATEIYLSENSNYKKQEGNVYCITLGDLVNDGKLNNPINDFKTGKVIPLDKTVMVNVNDYLEYEYEVVNKKDCESKNAYTEELLNGADPVLGTDLIPVTIESNGKVKKADIYSKWYSYEDKQWANAVMLTDTGKVENDGTIKEESIESYFVWIPRYKYKIFDLGNYSSYIEGKKSKSNAKTIQIVFENKDMNISNATSVDSYLTHPAFTSFDTNGLWVGKFETTGSLEHLTIKPGLTSLRNQTVSSMFASALSYNTSNKSHMMKNTEWGAVAYLSHSKYGINKEININNNSDFLTGYGAKEGTDQSDLPGTFGKDSTVTLPYNTADGYKASTTGNITGVYDMSGGSHEYMASYVDGNLGESGFTTDPATTYGNEYFDKYNSTSHPNSYNNRILGDATGEIGPSYFYSDGDGWTRRHNSWYDDDFYFINSSAPWFQRGGANDFGILGGQFSFTSNTGNVSQGQTGFRMVLVG